MLAPCTNASVEWHIVKYDLVSWSFPVRGEAYQTNSVLIFRVELDLEAFLVFFVTGYVSRKATRQLRIV